MGDENEELRESLENTNEEVDEALDFAGNLAKGGVRKGVGKAAKKAAKAAAKAARKKAMTATIATAIICSLIDFLKGTTLLDIEFIPHPPDGLDAVAFFAHLGAEFFDVGIYSAGITEIIVIPHIVQNLFPGERNALVFHEIRKKLEFLEA